MLQKSIVIFGGAEMFVVFCILLLHLLPCLCSISSKRTCLIHLGRSWLTSHTVTHSWVSHLSFWECWHLIPTCVAWVPYQLMYKLVNQVFRVMVSWRQIQLPWKIISGKVLPCSSRLLQPCRAVSLCFPCRAPTQEPLQGWQEKDFLYCHFPATTEKTEGKKNSYILVGDHKLSMNLVRIWSWDRSKYSLCPVVDSMSGAGQDWERWKPDFRSSPPGV